MGWPGPISERNPERCPGFEAHRRCSLQLLWRNPVLAMKRIRTSALQRNLLAGLLLGLLALPLAADDKKPVYPTPPKSDGVSVMPPAWEQAEIKPLTSAELDALLLGYQKEDELSPSPRTTDEQFLRRVLLDTVGRLPSGSEVQQFSTDADPQKRAKLIDRLLASDEFARHWASEWRGVVSALLNETRIRVADRQFEEWLFEQMKSEQSWSEIARGIITARGDLLFPRGQNPRQISDEVKVEPNGASFFLLAHMGNDAINERAAATSRVFLGIQIQCAQCHDHPSDIWKHEQFHQFAAFFARMREQRVNDPNTRQPVALRVASLPRGEHQMPDARDPSRRTLTHPRFITGEALPPGRPDAERRQALADFITKPTNYWFAAAFANRTWANLMGQGFYQPVDNLGPLQEATYPEVLLALAAHLRATDFDIRGLYRLILNSEAYQRQARTGQAPDEHLRFTANYPTRLRAEDLWTALVQTVGGVEQTGRVRDQRRPARPPANPFAQNVERLFVATFSFDPSAKPDTVEGTVPQALMLMNNRLIQEKLRASGPTILAELLRQHADDDEALRALYLRVLARKPTSREVQACLDHLRTSPSRAAGFEDILWCLINSAEFATRR